MGEREEEQLRLAEANQHIAEAEENIQLQQERIKELQADGHPTEQAIALLFTLFETLATMKEHRSFILDRLHKLDSAH